MKKDYREYSFEELSRDDFFRLWVLNHHEESATFWQNWMEENPDCIENIHLAKALLLTLQEKESSLNESDLEAITEQIVADNGVKLSFWKSPVFRVAASIALIVGIGFLGFQYFTKNQELAKIEEITPNLSTNYIETENNSTSNQEIKLEDGSQITLYPKSKIRYPKSFSTQIREVYLTGQAFFQIEKNPKRPFWVYTDYISTQVLGTSFMVKANENEKNIKVEVRSGKVSVYRREDLEKAKIQKKNELAGIILTPNQQVEYTITDDRLLKSIIKQPEVLIAETSKSFSFDETPISKVFAMLEKAYGIHIIFDEKNMENCYLTASFSDESLYDKLNLICKITHSTYEIVDAQIVIHSKGC